MLGLPVPRIYLQSGCHLHDVVAETSAHRIHVPVRYAVWVNIDSVTSACLLALIIVVLLS